jgi:selenocysteine lyase/cysteine desulfurase
MGISDEEAKGYVNCMDMKTPGMIRISFGIYNTEEEVDQFLVDLNKVVDELREQMLAEPEHLMFEYPNY